jgi:hypothetical protein
MDHRGSIAGAPRRPELVAGEPREIRSRQERGLVGSRGRVAQGP